MVTIAAGWPKYAGVAQSTKQIMFPSDCSSPFQAVVTGLQPPSEAIGQLCEHISSYQDILRITCSTEPICNIMTSSIMRVRNDDVYSDVVSE